MRIKPDEVMVVNGRLTQVGVSFCVDKKSTRHAVFECECGQRVVVFLSSVKSGHGLSCGCLRRELSRTRMLTHGQASKGNNSPTYTSWIAMKKRCSAGSETHWWKYYAAKGITISERWVDSFEAFLADMGERPEGKTLDRKNGNLGYSKENCRWATWKEQASNRNPLEKSS